jgi:hypothetical protein
MTLRSLERQTADDFSALTNGTHIFGCVFPDGREHSVQVHVQKARAKIRKAHFDICSTDWGFRDDENPNGNTSIRVVSVDRERFGFEMRRCVEMFPQLLMRLSEVC